LTEQYARSGLWLISDKLIRAVINFAISVTIIKHLGKDGYGVFSYTQSLIFVFISISGLGLDSIIVKKIVYQKESAESILNKCISLKLISGAIAAVMMMALFIFQNYDQPKDVIYFGVIASISVVFASLNIFDLYFQAIVKGKFSAIAGYITIIFSSAFKLYLIYSGVDLIYFSLSFIFDYLLLLVILISLTMNSNKLKLKFIFDLGFYKLILSESWPLFISAIVVSISMRLDQFIIKSLLSFSDVGVYAASVKISESWLFVPMAIANAYFPSMINAKSISYEYYSNTMRKIYTLVIYIGLSFVLFVQLFGKYLLDMIYGSEFSEVFYILQIHAWTGIFSGLLVVSGKWYINEGLTKLALTRNLFSLFVGVFLNYLLIPLYGLQGAAYSVLIAIICSSLIFDLLGKSTRHQFFLKLESILFYRSLK
jgi:O-antigen/teichoic acid export membrane protein